MGVVCSCFCEDCASLRLSLPGSDAPAPAPVSVPVQPAHLRPSQEVLTQDYIRSMRLLQNTSR